MKNNVSEYILQRVMSAEQCHHYNMTPTDLRNRRDNGAEWDIFIFLQERRCERMADSMSGFCKKHREERLQLTWMDPK